MSFKVLMQNRGNAFTQRGGDTIVMERLAENLRRNGLTVDFDVAAEADLALYDLVHLFNFATPELTEKLARRVHAAGKPYVVTTLYEDWPVFFNQMHLNAQALMAYIQAGQPKDHWRRLAAAIKTCEPKARLENGWCAAHAAALLSTGRNESESIKRDYGENLPVSVNHLGCDITATEDGGELFFSEHKLRDFVLCVGRLETRKNQLMLLKALEDSDLTVVLVTGGFTYQPEYSEACRAFRRKGKTVFLDRLSPEMLSSSFAAAKVHALPSWYELPGLVSLEAARLGCQVVVSNMGTPKDYFGELALYARPDDPEDISNAVTAAYYKPKDDRLSKQASHFTWEQAAAETQAIYQQVLGTAGK